MTIDAVRSVIVLPVLILIIVLLTALQIFLSLQKNQWLGLVLPIIYVGLALLLSFGAMIYTGDIVPILLALLLYLIPAAINIAIYLACRAKVKDKQKQELEKMNIHDLD
ncbi:hypothetical protein [Acidaminobacter hydrogenoformans]|uniref:Uncharacterized protein n=1 Tax=Acidaminobacter hydrogenoformans DSM 2784 TaxID=1120920 RepID=A0A1G5S093_9FIRM|nr:hypothetical protein [Acidaminobacter hydrogenoformans]SCZ79804.1 hypothetical protein SAMN03080599_01937 [Acidaminobacter hydrogenoformans DSM 2784]